MNDQPFDNHSENTPDSLIEFRCVRCGRLLRVPAAASGRQAQCPQCKAIVDVPVTVPTEAEAAEIEPMSTPAEPASPNVATAANVPLSGPDFEMDANPAGVDVLLTNPIPAPSAESVIPAETVPTAEFGHPPSSAEFAPIGQMFDRIRGEISKVYVGQEELVLGALVALFSGGHILIESVPGLGKTLFVRTLGQVLGCRFGRIQFTADLMPSDITGSPMFDMKTQEFRFRPGPVFTQFLLADEINRSPAKTHAALLEIMQEYRVTIDGQSHIIERPFLVLATQNPIESEGTYNLPEAQLDRFMFKLVADYPAAAEEASILKLHSAQIDFTERLAEQVETISSPAEILEVTRKCGEVRVDDRLIDYINSLVRTTRQWPQFHMGASPRAGIALVQASRTLAAFAGRDYAVPDDVVRIAVAALRHRVTLTAEAEVEGQKVDDLLQQLIRSVEVPRI